MKRELSKAQFMRETGLTRTRYEQDLRLGLIPSPIKTGGGQYRHRASDVQEYETNRKQHVYESTTTATEREFAEALAAVKPVY